MMISLLIFGGVTGFLIGMFTEGKLKRKENNREAIFHLDWILLSPFNDLDVVKRRIEYIKKQHYGEKSDESK